MKKLFTSTLLTLAAVPFLMAAPKAKKAQNQPNASTQAQSTTAKPKVHKKHVEANKSANAGAGNTAASSTPKQ